MWLCLCVLRSVPRRPVGQVLPPTGAVRGYEARLFRVAPGPRVEAVGALEDAPTGRPQEGWQAQQRLTTGAATRNIRRDDSRGLHSCNRSFPSPSHAMFNPKGLFSAVAPASSKPRRQQYHPCKYSPKTGMSALRFLTSCGTDRAWLKSNQGCTTRSRPGGRPEAAWR